MRLLPTGSLLVLALAASPPALADGPRDFTPDRPSRSDSPFTVAEGFGQFESDLINYTHTGAVLQALDPTLKYGISHDADVEIVLGGFVQTQQGAGTVQGFGDTIVRAKIGLLGDDGGDIALAVIPFVKIPTARAPIGNGQAEGGIAVPVLFSLPWDFGLTVEPELSALKNALNNGKQASFTGVVNLGRRIIGDLSGFVEIYAQTYTDHATAGPTITVDYGVSYLLTKTVQLDAGANVGLNRATPSLNVYSGIAFRF